jgi:plastocyanin
MRRLRGPLLMAVAALLGASAVVLPAVASSEASPTVEAVHEGGLYGGYRWKPPSVTVGAGGAVTFSNPSAEVPHGIEWKSGNPETPSCGSGVPVNGSANESGTKWSGTCTFSKPGVYTFWCTVHKSEMTGTITVTATGTTTSTTTTTSGSTPSGESQGGGAGQSTTSSPSAVGGATSLLTGSTSSAVKVASNQHGNAIRGSLNISPAGEGGQLEVDALAKFAALAKNGHGGSVRVGKLVISHLHAGPLTFALKLNSRARSALRRHHRLALSVRLIVSAPHGSTLTITRGVVAHA